MCSDCELVQNVQIVKSCELAQNVQILKSARGNGDGQRAIRLSPNCTLTVSGFISLFAQLVTEQLLNAQTMSVVNGYQFCIYVSE